MSRFWPAGVPITVTCDALATPLSFVWEGQRHPIAQVIDRYRDDTRWWQRRVWRENFLVITETGLLLLIFHDARAQEWRMQRLYD